MEWTTTIRDISRSGRTVAVERRGKMQRHAISEPEACMIRSWLADPEAPAVGMSHLSGIDALGYKGTQLYLRRSFRAMNRA